MESSSFVKNLLNILKFIVQKNDSFDGEIFSTSLKEVSAKRGKKERRNLYENYRSWAVTPMVWKVIDFLHLIKNIMVTLEPCSEPSQTSKMELFAKVVNSSKSLIVFARSSILDDWFGSEYACFVRKKQHFVSISFKKNIGEVNRESVNMLAYALPEPVLHFIRSLVPGDIKGKIREVWIQIDRLPSGNSIFFFHMQVVYVFWNFLQRNLMEVEKHF